MYGLEIMKGNGGLLFSSEIPPLSIVESKVITQSQGFGNFGARTNTIQLDRTYSLSDVIICWRSSNGRYRLCRPLVSNGLFSSIQVSTPVGYITGFGSEVVYPSTQIEVIICTLNLNGIVTSSGWGISVFKSNGLLSFTSSTPVATFCSNRVVNSNDGTFSLSYLGDNRKQNSKKYLTAFIQREDVRLLGMLTQTQYVYSAYPQFYTNITTQNNWPTSPIIQIERLGDFGLVHDGTGHPIALSGSFNTSVGVVTI